MDQALITQDSSVIKQANKLIESVYRMDANEQKIILLAAKFVYDMEKKKEEFTTNTEIVITAAEYANEYGITRQTAFEVISKAKNTLYERSFEYDYKNPETGEVKPMSSRWIHSKGEMKAKSEISMFFAPAVIPLIYLVQQEFTLLDIKEIGRLKSKYAIRLYQILMKWRNADFQPKFEYQDLRAKLGVEDGDYTLMADFKKGVINVAVKQINQGTGFVGLKYSTVKKGNTITHFTFSYDKYDNKTINVTPINSQSATRPKKTKKANQQLTEQKAPNSANESDLGDDFSLTPPEPKARKKVKRHFEGGMTEPQAYMFAGKIVNKIKEGDTRFMYLSKFAHEGEQDSSFSKRIADDFLVGNLEPYQEALSYLGYKHHK
ncbi:RepB family plasmid replication initiator protein [Acinetobacter baumannii]|uniref:RepB family plasmid replication initiator protein n=1 Tax=Acinetobacter baumannii TaxID=470 RepID=UPI0024487B25|nr:RepB family plasmid replication initiator protein [Acinetobacter baumannii]MDH2549447.1 RepB family plasmid replication initiator protein [Acinetobacter baumannii]